MRRVHPDPVDDLTDLDLTAAYAGPEQRPWLRANMVSTLDGTMRGSDGASRSVSSRADERAFAVVRRSADVVLVGAGTVRAEDYRPSVRPVAIVTSRLDLPLSLRMFAERGPQHARPIAFTTDAAAEAAPAALREVIDVVGCGAGSVDLVRVIARLHDRGLVRILCEGGPALLSALLAADLVDELLLTLTPLLLGGGPAEHIVDVPGGLGARLRPTQVLEEDGTVLLTLVRAG